MSTFSAAAEVISRFQRADMKKVCVGGAGLKGMRGLVMEAFVAGKEQYELKALWMSSSKLLMCTFSIKNYK